MRWKSNQDMASTFPTYLQKFYFIHFFRHMFPLSQNPPIIKSLFYIVYHQHQQTEKLTWLSITKGITKNVTIKSLTAKAAKKKCCVFLNCGFFLMVNKNKALPNKLNKITTKYKMIYPQLATSYW